MLQSANSFCFAHFLSACILIIDWSDAGIQRFNHVEQSETEDEDEEEEEEEEETPKENGNQKVKGHHERVNLSYEDDN